MPVTPAIGWKSSRRNYFAFFRRAAQNAFIRSE